MLYPSMHKIVFQCQFYLFDFHSLGGDSVSQEEARKKQERDQRRAAVERRVSMKYKVRYVFNVMVYKKT